MKKIISLITIIAMPYMVSAQSANEYYFDRGSFNVCAVIFVIMLFMTFILLILKRIFDFRLKNKIVDKGIPENIIASILQTSPKEDGNVNIKWFAILAGLGLAFIIIYYTQPLGIHSLAIMSLCISVSFLGYYFFNKHSEE
jgi:hypothetical protein